MQCPKQGGKDLRNEWMHWSVANVRKNLRIFILYSNKLLSSDINLVGDQGET